ncbi:MAG: hypothetical protein QOI95_2015 [Acidimicrobiaceae bacterium]|jgi:NAD(P)-dependent dehydrogenase (short-subunit alcohol dehydrogenase family)
MSKRGVAVVTGGGRGIGAETARVLATRGWDVCVGYATGVDSAEVVAEQCREAGRIARAVQADVAEPMGAARLFEAAEALGTVTVLVNNAAIVLAESRVDETSFEPFTRLLAVNVVGPFLCAREAVRRMSTRYGGRGGAIVNISSIAARNGASSRHVDYAATKGAIESMTIGLAHEVAAEGIRVNCVRPGFIETAMHQGAGSEEGAEDRRRAAALLRGGRPDEVANTVAWLCSDEASYVVGAIVEVSGGR